MPAPLPVPDDFDDAISAYQAGESEQSIALRYKVSRNVVARWLALRGVARRDGSAAMRVRWAHATPGERAAMLTPAHSGSRKPRDEAAKVAAAQHRERSLSHVAVDEEPVRRILDSLRYPYRRQAAVGPYNVDFLVCESVAVEVTRAPWSHGHSAFRERHHTILDADLSLLYVRSPVVAIADVQRQIVAAMEGTDRNPPLAVGEYRVVGRRGQDATGCRSDPYQRAVVHAGEA